VLIGEQTVTFEPDEEGSYRAMNTPEKPVTSPVENINLLKVVAEKLAKLP